MVKPCHHQHHAILLHLLTERCKGLRKQHALDRCCLIGDGEHGHALPSALARLGNHRTNARQHATNYHGCILTHLRNLLDRSRAECGNFILVLIKWVPTDMESKRLFLIGERLHALPRRGLAQRGDGGCTNSACRRANFKVAKECHLPNTAIFILCLPAPNGVLNSCNQRRARFHAVQSIKCAALDQCLNGGAIDRAQIHTVTELKEVLEATALLSFRNDGHNGTLARTLDGLQAKAHVAVAVVVGFVIHVDHREVRVGKIDIGRTNFNANVRARIGAVRIYGAPALIKVDRPIFHLLCLAFKGQHRSHEVIGEPGLEIRSLVGNNGVTRGMALIEAVSSEFHDEIKELIGARFSESAFRGTMHKLRARGRDHLLVLLADRLNQRVCLTEWNASQ